jgi:hypothetical protein
VDDFIARVERLEARLATEHAALDEVQISPLLRHGARFVLREGLVLAATLPIAIVGRVMHWLPLRLARTLALRPLTNDPSRDQPAMRTIVLGLAFVLLWYILQGALAAHWFGAVDAFAWLIVLAMAGRIDFLLRDRLHRAWRRARTYLALRANPGLHEQALAEIRALVAEGLALETALIAPLTGGR